MGGPLRETSRFCPGFRWLKLLSCCHGYLFQSDNGNTQERVLWTFPLPFVYAGPSDCQLALPAIHPDSPWITGETLREKTEADVLTREMVRA